MQGKGTFYDPRLDDAAKFPVAAANGFGHVRREPDLVTPKLGALQLYQLSIVAPRPPLGSFDARAAERGKALFAADGKARCASCHVPPLYTEPGFNLHTPEEMGIDAFQAQRGPEDRYRTTPLRGLWTHTKGGFYHDGRFPTLLDVVEHYDAVQGLGLSASDERDLVEFLKSL
jgi:cytochrome c peroxidase